MGAGPAVRMLITQFYTCYIIRITIAVSREKGLISTYFKPSQDPIGISHPVPSRQGGEAHDCDNEVTQRRGSESEESDIDEHSASTMESEAGSRLSASKRARVDHYDSEWQRKYDWLTPVRGSSDAVVGMLCDLCKKHKTISRNGSSKWSIEPCICLRVDAVTRHLKCRQHKTSMSKELVLQQVVAVLHLC